MSDESVLQPVVRKLETLCNLDADDLAGISALPIVMSSPPAGSYLIQDGRPVKSIYALVEGYAYRAKSTEDGRSQIVSFHVPGDLIDLGLLLNERCDTDVVTIGETRIAAIPLPALRTLKEERPNLADALWRDTLLDAAIFREWVLNIGQRDSRTRIAHMLAEFVARRAVAVPNEAARFMLPFNQLHIAAATGMTAIHVNRMLRDLEAEGALSRSRGHIVMGDQQQLMRIAGFDPSYLLSAAAHL